MAMDKDDGKWQQIKGERWGIGRGAHVKAVGELEEVGDGREQRHLATDDGVCEEDDGVSGRTGPPSSTPLSRLKKTTTMEPLDVFSGAGEVGAHLSGGSDEDDRRQRLKVEGGFDPIDGEGLGLSRRAEPTWTTTVVLRDVSVRRGVDGGRGIDGAAAPEAFGRE